MTTDSSPVIVISGCSTGFGRELVHAALKHNLRVIATARNPSSIEDLKISTNVETLALDVTKPFEDLQKFAEKAISLYGRVDYVINNAGYLLGGAIEESTDEENKAQFQTLFFGVINVTNAFLPYMRQVRRGMIVNISSQGGSLNLAGAGLYCAAKAAIDSLSETWARELADFNIRCMSVQLGSFRTSVATSGSLRTAPNHIEGYHKAHDWVKGFAGAAMKETGDPRKAAERVMEVITTKEQLPALFPLGDDAVDDIPGVYKARLEEFGKWRALGVNTSFED